LPPRPAVVLPPPPGSTDRAPGNGSGLKVAALVTGGAGVVGLGVGAVFGAMSLSKHNEAAQECPGRTCPSMTGSKAWSDAVSLGNVSTVAFVAGGAVLAAGVVLWFVAPRPTENGGASAQLSVGPSSVSLRGTW
jgi:hypothetical protein